MFGGMGQTNVKNLGNGGTIDGDLTISGDLTVSGGGSLSFDEIIEGTQVIDITSTEAFLVRKNGDGGDLFTLDTTNSRMLFAGEMRLNDKDGDGTFGGRIRYDNSDNELRIEANEVSGDDVAIKGNDAIKFEDSGGTKMILDGGNLGIGIENPDTLLHLKSTSASKPILKIENEQGGSNPVSIQMLRNTSSPDDDDFIGQIDFRSMNDASTPEEILYAYISSQSTDITDGTEDGEINFFTMKAGTLINTMTMQSGEVGIGDSDPAKILSVKATGNDDGISLKNSSGQFLALIHQQDSDAGMLRLYDESSTTKIAFNADSGENSYFNTGGNVGIGVTAPDKLLTLGQDAADGAQTAYLKILDTDTDTTADTLLEILWSKYHTGTSAADVASIGGGVEQWSGTSSNRNTYMDFRTVTSGSRTEKMRIHSDGTIEAKAHHIKLQSGKELYWGSGGCNIKSLDGSSLNFNCNDSGVFTMMGGVTTTGASLTLSTREPSVVANDVLGQINFQAQLDTGADSDLVGANIKAMATDTFSDTVNATDLIFSTGASETATEAMRLQSDKAALFSGQIHLGSTNQFRIYSEGSGGSDNQIILARLNNLRILNQHDGGNISFGTDTSGGASVTNMILDSDSKISLSNNDANTSNTVFGKNAFNDGGSDVGADYNVAIGELAMGTGTLGASVNNVAIGYRALTDITGSGGGGDDNVAIGYDSTTSITTGRKNVAIGMNSLKGSTDADQSVVIGALACENGDVDVDGVVAVGFSALNDLTDGAQNTAIGYKAMSELTSSASNVAVGYEALKVLATGSGSNIAIGHGALDEILTGCCNIAIGTNALGNCDGAENENIAIGNNAGLNLDNGINNTIVGANANASVGNANGQIVIGKDVTGANNAFATLGLSTSIKSIDLTSSSASWSGSSDERLKENIQTSTAGLSFINELRPVTFNWKKAKDVDKSMSQYQDSEEPALGGEGTYGKIMHGFVAQEVKSAIDKHSEVKEGFSMWQEWQDGTQAVSDGALVPMLVKAIQELSARVEELESK